MIEFDKHCIKILTVLLLEKQEAHFNELYKLIREKMKLKKFSKPTFNTHLKHLMEAGFVKRTPDKGQKVTYSLNLEKIGEMKEYAERVKRITKNQNENMQEFFALTEEKQINRLLGFQNYRKLYEIKARIELELEPDSFEKLFILNFFNLPALEQLTVWVVKRCVKDEVYRKKILEIIENSLEVD